MTETIVEPPDADATRLRALRRCLQHKHLSVRYYSADQATPLSENLADDWAGDDGEAAEERLRVIMAAVLEGSASATSEIEVRGEDGRRIHELTCLPDRQLDGRLAGLITIIADVSEERERDMAIASLLREVSHRSKNLLAIVLSIAAQTSHHAGNIDDFLHKFRGRIQALASTQDLVTESNWMGTAFRALVLAQLAKDGHSARRPIEFSGDNPTLSPNAAMHVGLAMHELITNATLHGALSNGHNGSIRLDATVEPDEEGGMRLVIDWRERYAPHELFPPPRHFGTVVLEQIVPRS
ncbi:MAG TPA: HWE histidine kinase domain-containing protein, partial [Devosia sp.]